MAKTIHVSAAKGDDRNAGTAAKPLATIGAAVEMAAGWGGEIRVHAGVYSTVDAPVVIGRDRGGPGADRPLVIRAAGDGEAIVTGGVSAGKWTAVTERGALARISPDVIGRIRQYDLKAAGLTGFGEMRSRGHGRPVEVAHAEVFCGGQPMTVAQYPKKGHYLAIADTPAGGEAISPMTDGYYYDDERPRRWKDDPDIRAHGYWAYNWANSYERLEVFDKQRMFIKNAPPYGNYGFLKGNRFYFLNVLEELTEPGEYYIDKQTGMMYLYPPETGIGASTGDDVFVSAAEHPLIKLDGARNVTIEGLVLEYGRADGLYAENFRNIRVEACCFRNFGNRAAVFKNGFGLTVSGSDFYNTGDGCLDITAGDRMTLESGETEVSNCHFHHFGRWTRCYVTAVNAWGVGICIRNNLIHDCPHTAILFGGNDIVVRSNEIYNVCLETGDAGAIYTERDLSFQGTEIRDNYIHHLGAYGPIESFAVYCDCCLGSTVISGNYFQDVSSGVSNNGGYNVTVADNVSVNATHKFVSIAAHGMHPSEAVRFDVDVTLKTRFYSVPADKPLYTDRYPLCKFFDSIFKEAEREGKPAFVPNYTRVENNIVRNAARFFDKHWTIKDEMYVLKDNDVAEDKAAELKPFLRDNFRSIGLTGGKRFSVPVKILCELTEPAPGVLRLTAKNEGATPAEAEISLYDALYNPADIPENNFRLRLAPGESVSHDFRGDFGDKKYTYVEARSSTPGIRPARYYKP